MQKTKTQLQQELQDKALQIIGNQYNIGLDIGTGGGKTLLGLRHMEYSFHNSASFLVLVPKTSIQNDWIREAEIHGYEHLLSYITFANYRSIKKQSFDHDWVYADECHSLKYSHAEWLDSYRLNGGKLLGLSGTYPKRQGEKFEMCNTYCPKIFSYDINQAIDEGMLNNYKIYVHMLKLNNNHTVIKKRKNGTAWKTSEVKDYRYWCKQLEIAESQTKKMKLRILRMKAMQQYSTKIEYAKSILKKIDHKAIIFTTTQKQADELCKYSYHSNNKNSEKNLKMFSEGKIYRLSCVEQLSEGKTIPKLKVGIITHAYSNDTKTRQKIGRFLRLSPEETAIIHILCYEDTIDFQWIRNALSTFKQHQIKIFKP